MNSVVTGNLSPGIALSAAQMAQLSSDIVWLVERDVSLPGGGSTKALVPQVYARVQPGDLMGTGSLLAGREVNLQLGGDMTNSGTVAGRSVVSLNAQNVHNLGGRITGNTVQLNARSDLNNIGGQIDAASRLNVAAARDLNVVTTTTSASNQTGGISSASSNTFSMTGIDRAAGPQDSSRTTSRQSSAGGSISVSAAGVPVGGGISASRSNIYSNFTSVTEQTARHQSRRWRLSGQRARQHRFEGCGDHQHPGGSR